MANSPTKLVADHLKLDDEFVNKIEKRKQPVFRGELGKPEPLGELTRVLRV
jgi:hypothetical protein